jgi:fucose permease
LGYVIFAIYFNWFGTTASVMMAYYNITSAQQGLIFTVQSVGGLIMAVFFAFQGERFNKINMISAAIFTVGGTALAVALAPPYAVLLLLVVAGGAGCSTIDVMMNSMIPELYPKQKNTLLPVAHGFFGTGALTAPLLITALVDPAAPRSFTRPFVWIGVIGVCVFAAFLIFSRRILSDTPYSDKFILKRHTPDKPAEIFTYKKAWMFLAAGFTYFSFQIGIMSWLPTYCEEVGMSFSTSGAVLTAFFVGSLLMRFSGPLILKKLKACDMFILFGLLSAAVVSAALFFPSAIMPLIAAGGFMQGSCVALLVLMATDAFPNRIASASSLTFISANAASMTAPFWMGSLAQVTGFRIPLLIACGLLVCSVALITRITKWSRAFSDDRYIDKSERLTIL